MLQRIKPKLFFRNSSFYILAFVSTCILSCSNNKVPKLKIWNDELSWSDFNKVKSIEDGVSAKIYTGVYCPYELTTLDNQIFAYMDRVQSIKKRNISDSSGILLKHEKYHFNITEYFARLVRKNVIGLGKERLTSARIESICNFYSEKRINFQLEYDKATNHSLNKEIQLLWENKIDSLLSSLKNYSDPSINHYNEFKDW